MTRLTYERTTRDLRDTMNHFHYDKGELFCEQQRVAELAEEFGTPCWIYSKAALLGRLKEIQTAFAAVDPVICYSVKANSNLSILKLKIGRASCRARV